jgi:hypothetical protein
MNIGPKPINPNVNNIQQANSNSTPNNSFNNRPSSSAVNQSLPAPLSESEEFISKSFEKFRDNYFECFPDETKQKDFNNKIIALSNKLKNHDLKQNLLNILTEFINGIYIFYYNLFL